MWSFLANLISIIVIVCLVTGALVTMYRAKKNGAKCLGCQYSDGCSACSCKKNTNNDKSDN